MKQKIERTKNENKIMQQSIHKISVKAKIKA